MRLQKRRIEHDEAVILFLVGNTGCTECRNYNQNECQVTDKENCENLFTLCGCHGEYSSSRPQEVEKNGQQCHQANHRSDDLARFQKLLEFSFKYGVH